MSTGFLASNGIPVTLTDDDRLIVENIDHTYPATVAAGEHVEALREFFRAEEDARLGRWRWPEDARVVVYPWSRDYVNVVSETNGASIERRRDDVELGRHLVGVSDLERAARAYFDAHPEPKPWHNAGVGEAWCLTIDRCEMVAVVVEDSVGTFGSDRKFFTPLRGGWGLRAGAITGGRRIWPEDAS